jgi:hypothetical protein
MILFTADIHLKLGAKNVPVEWAKQRYYDFFDQVHEASKGCDLHIIGGDIFDRVPTMEELELYFDFIRSIDIPTIIYDGNHEATKKNSTFLVALSKASMAINEYVMVVTETYETSNFTILPYCQLHKSNSIEGLDHSKPLFTHVRGAIEPHVVPEVDLNRFNAFPVVFAGDLHAHSNTQRNIVYPGSPITTSFHRNKVETGYLLINDDWSWRWKPFDLPQLLRKTVSSPEEMVKGHKDHIIYELEGDLGDLSSVKNSELLDKKVVKRSNDTSLILNKNMTMAEELVEYLKYILEISDDKIPEIVGLFNDYTKDVKLE